MQFLFSEKHFTNNPTPSQDFKATGRPLWLQPSEPGESCFPDFAFERHKEPEETLFLLVALFKYNLRTKNSLISSVQLFVSLLISFSKFTELCSSDHTPNLEHFQQRDPCAHLLQAAANLLPVSRGFCAEKGRDLIYIIVTVVSFLLQYNKVPVLFLD